MRGLMSAANRDRLHAAKRKELNNMQTTLCYIEKDGRTLMLHRVKK